MNNKITLPTLLTWARIVLVPFFIGVYYLPDSVVNSFDKNIISTSMFGFAAITDYLDGYLARKLKQETSFGAFLDPVADKAIIATSLVILVHLNRTFTIAAIIIIIREIAISALREWMAQLGKKENIAVHYLGKLKTFIQMLAISLLLLDYHTNLLGNICMIIAVIFTIISMVYYLDQAKKQFD